LLAIVAVIPTLGNDIPRLNKAISSVQKHTRHPGLEIVVVDNSKSQSLEGMLPVDRIIRTGINLGYVGALELVRRKLDFDYLWSIQDDMELANDVLFPLLTSLEKNKKLAMVSPVLLKGGMVPAGSCGGTFKDEGRVEWRPFPSADCLPIDTEVIEGSLAYLSAAGALFRKEALNDVRGFNLALFPLIAIDVDICTRLMEKGWGIQLIQKAHVSHMRQGSSKGLIGQVMWELNVPVVHSYLEGSRATLAVPTESVDPEVLFEIARKSSFLFLDVANTASKRMAQLEQEVKHANFRVLSMERSISWRLTKPLRVISDFIERKFLALIGRRERSDD
jgi:GT2 family glycosyltransferase